MGINENTSSRARLVYNSLLNAPEVLEDDATMRLCHTAEYSKVNPEVRQHPIIAILPGASWIAKWSVGASIVTSVKRVPSLRCSMWMAQRALFADRWILYAAIVVSTSAMNLHTTAETSGYENIPSKALLLHTDSPLNYFHALRCFSRFLKVMQAWIQQGGG